jgi:hypothetical protein
MLVDPFLTGDIIDIRVGYAILGLQYFLLNTTILLVAFYWQEALQSIKMDSLRLGILNLFLDLIFAEKMKIPAGIVLGIWWAIFLVIVILLGVGNLDVAQYLYSAAYASSIGFAVFFVWTSAKIFKVLMKNREISIGRKVEISWKFNLFLFSIIECRL